MKINRNLKTDGEYKQRRKMTNAVISAFFTDNWSHVTFECTNADVEKYHHVTLEVYIKRQVKRTTAANLFR